MNAGTDSKRILVTGAAGTVGRYTCRALRYAGHHVVGLDRAPMPNGFEVDRMHIGYISDGAMLRELAEDVDVMIHLAATPDVADYLTQLLPNNIIGAYHVFEAARLARVSRLIVASTVQLIMPLNWKQRVITLDDPPTPDNHYALTKLYGEEMARMYARMHGMSVLAVRLGWMPRHDQHCQAFATEEPNQSIYLSTNDAGHAFCRAVTAERPKAGEAEVIMISSKPKRAIGMDLTPAKHIIGFEPRDEYPEGLPEHLRS